MQVAFHRFEWMSLAFRYFAPTSRLRLRCVVPATPIGQST